MRRTKRWNVQSLFDNHEPSGDCRAVPRRQSYVGNLVPMPPSSLGRDGLGYGRDADHAGTSDRHRRGDHTDRHHAQCIEFKRDTGAPVSLLQKRHQR